VDAHAIDQDLAPRAGLATVDPLSRKTTALGHEDDANGRVRDHLELDLLAQTTAVAASAAAIGAQALANNEQWTIALDQFNGNIGDIAGPGVGALPIVAVGGPHAPIEKQ